MSTLRVMLADDSATTRMVLRGLLEPYGQVEVVAEASNGAEAIQMYHEYRPDLVFCDIIMPKLDGMRVLQTIRSTSPEARFVMITSISDTQVILQCMEHGAIDYILKPFDAARVRTFIESLDGMLPAFIPHVAIPLDDAPAEGLAQYV